MDAQLPLLILQVSFRRQKYHYVIIYNNRPRRGKLVQLFVGATDGHAVFTTSLRLDASFAMTPHALRPDLDRGKSASGFEAQTGQTRLSRF